MRDARFNAETSPISGNPHRLAPQTGNREARSTDPVSGSGLVEFDPGTASATASQTTVRTGCRFCRSALGAGSTAGEAGHGRYASRYTLRAPTGARSLLPVQAFVDSVKGRTRLPSQIHLPLSQLEIHIRAHLLLPRLTTWFQAATPRTVKHPWQIMSTARGLACISDSALNLPRCQKASRRPNANLFTQPASRPRSTHANRRRAISHPCTPSCSTHPPQARSDTRLHSRA